MPNIMIKVQETRRPISGTLLGYRLLAAEHNMACNNLGNPSPSFAKPYFVCEDSDRSVLTIEHVRAFQTLLKRWRGASNCMLVGELVNAVVVTGRPLDMHESKQTAPAAPDGQTGILTWMMHLTPADRKRLLTMLETA